MATDKEIIDLIREIESVETLRQIFKDVADALRRKGVEKDDIHPIEYAGLIDGISTGTDTDDATATENDILYGETAYARGKKLNGNIEIKSGIRSLTASGSTKSDGSYEIFVQADVRKGYYPQDKTYTNTQIIEPAGSISGNLGATSGASWSTTDPNRGSGQVTITNINQTPGYQRQRLNDTITVSVPANRLLKGRTITPTTTEQVIANAEDIVYNTIKVAGAATLLPSNIKKGVSIFDVIGTLETGTETADATATKTDIASGKTAYVNGSKITGSLVEVGSGLVYSIESTDDPYINSGNFYLRRTMTVDRIFRVGSIASGYCLASKLGDATAADVVAGKTFTSKSGVKLIGTATLGVDTSSATATATDIASGKTAYVNGAKITGSIATTEADSTYNLSSAIPSISGSYFYLKKTMTANRLLRTGAIASAYCTKTQLGDAAATDVVSGKTFTSTNGLSITGSITEVKNGSTYSAGSTTDLSVSGSYLYMKKTMSGDRILRSGSIFSEYSTLSNFGNATAADVVAGKTFTSSAGLKVTGTASLGGIFTTFTPAHTTGIELVIPYTGNNINSIKHIIGFVTYSASVGNYNDMIIAFHANLASNVLEYIYTHGTSITNDTGGSIEVFSDYFLLNTGNRNFNFWGNPAVWTCILS